VKLLLDPPNLLLMDEPTTHLDMASIDALIAALEQYQGTLIFISHDVYFIRKLARHVLHVDAGKLTFYTAITVLPGEISGHLGGIGRSPPVQSGTRNPWLSATLPVQPAR